MDWGQTVAINTKWQLDSDTRFNLANYLLSS